MKVEISQSLCAKFPSVVIGVLRCANLKNVPSTPATDELLLIEEQRIKSQFTKESYIQHPKITLWRKAYAEFGVKPKDAKSSIENLYRLILSGREIRRISTLVDVYNAASLRHMLPMGGEDLNTIVGDIVLDIAGDQEPAVKLLGDEAPETPLPGEVIYKDQVSAICRRWNWREADRTKLVDSTTECILIVEGLEPVTRAEVLVSLEDLARLVEEHCGARVTSFVLDATQRVSTL